MIEKMDDKTTLIVWGDHGMTPEGQHGGGSEIEMRTVFFAYQKTPMPMYEHFNKKEFKKTFKEFNKNMKHLDMASTLAMIFNVPFPYSNVGLFHPLLAQTNDLKVVL